MPNAPGILLFVLSTVLLSSCASYQAKPLDSAAMQESLAAPSPALLQKMASELKHPRLPPLTLDFSKPLTDRELAVIAVIASPDLRAQRARAGVASAQVFSAGLLPDPQLSAGLDHPTSSGPDLVNAYNLGLSWDIFGLITRHAEQRIARTQAQQVRYDIAWQEWLTANQARLLGVRLGYLERQAGIAGQAEQVADSLYQAARRNLKRGDIKLDEFALRESALIDARDRLLALQREIEKNRQDLNRNLGLPPEQMLKLGIRPAAEPEATDPAQLFASARHERLDLLALQAGYASQEATLYRAVLGQFPRFNLGLSRASDTSGIRTIGASVSLDLPVFNRNRGNIALARATREQLFAEYSTRLFQTRADISQITADLMRLARERTALASKLPSLEHAESVLREASQRRDVPLLSYETIRASLLSYQLQLLSLDQNIAEQRVALDIAVGAPLQP